MRAGAVLHRLEDRRGVVRSGAMVVLPLAEIVLRRTLHTGIAGASLIVQHLALIVGMLGGAIAAREGRLLALSTLARRIAARPGCSRPRASSRAAVGCHDRGVPGDRRRDSSSTPSAQVGETLVYGIPVWTIELGAAPRASPSIALRHDLSGARTRWPGRLRPWRSPRSWSSSLALRCRMRQPRCFVPALVRARARGGRSALRPSWRWAGRRSILFWWTGEPIAAIPVSHYSLVTNPSIPSLPLFTLAGYFLAESGAPQPARPRVRRALRAAARRTGDRDRARLHVLHVVHRRRPA